MLALFNFINGAWEINYLIWGLEDCV